MTKAIVVLAIVAIAVLAIFSLLDSVTPGDGQVGESVMSGYNTIRETAEATFDAVDATGEGLSFETHESPLPALWELLKDIAEGD